MNIGRLGPTAAPVAPAAPQRTFTASSSAVASGTQRAYQALTPSDLDLVEAMAGYRPVEGGPMPIFAFFIAKDRQNGTLPAGTPITSDYLTDLASRLHAPGDSPDSALSSDRLAAGLAFLQLTGGRAHTDLLA